MKGFTIGGNQRRAEFVQELQCGLVARDTELFLELQCRDARRQGGNEVGGMKPKREWELASMHARAGGQTDLMPVPTLGHTPSGKCVAGGGPAPRTDKSRRPTQLVEIVCALLIRGEESLEFDKRPWSRLFGEWILRLHIIGQSCRIVVRDLIASHGHLHYRTHTALRSTLYVVCS